MSHPLIYVLLNSEPTMATMLEFIKTVLVKVSFDKKLFEKELRKALKVLLPDDVKRLKMWCYEHFSDKYHVVLNQYFSRHQLAL